MSAAKCLRMARVVSRREGGKAEGGDRRKKRREKGNFPFGSPLAYIAQHIILFQFLRNLEFCQF